MEKCQLSSTYKINNRKEKDYVYENFLQAMPIEAIMKCGLGKAPPVQLLAWHDYNVWISRSIK